MPEELKPQEIAQLQEDALDAFFNNDLKRLKLIMTNGLDMNEKFIITPLVPIFSNSEDFTRFSKIYSKLKQNSQKIDSLSKPDLEFVNRVTKEIQNPTRYAYFFIDYNKKVQTPLEFENYSFEYFQIDSSNKPEKFMRHTLLHYAAAFGKQDFVNLLIKKGANPDIKDSSGRKARQIAKLLKRDIVIEKVWKLKRKYIHKEYFKKEAKMSTLQKKGLIAFFTSNFELLEELINEGLDINEKFISSLLIPWQLADGEKFLKIQEKLNSIGPNQKLKNVLSPDEISFFDSFSKKVLGEKIKKSTCLFIHYLDKEIYLKNSKGRFEDLINVAPYTIKYCIVGDYENTEVVLHTLLHYAAAFNNQKMVDFLISKGAIPSIKDSLGRDAQEIALYLGNKITIGKEKFFYSFKDFGVDIETNFFIRKIIEMEMKQSERRSIFAFFNGDLDTLQELITDGLNINKPFITTLGVNWGKHDIKKISILFQKLQKLKEEDPTNPKVVSKLDKEDIEFLDVFVTEFNERKPTFVTYQFVDYLKRDKFLNNRESICDRDITILNSFLKHYFTLKYNEKKNEFICHTLLHYAAAFGKQEIADLLIRNGARPDIKDLSGRTAQQISDLFQNSMIIDRVNRLDDFGINVESLGIDLRKK
jgi:ankyrin repeat protein